MAGRLAKWPVRHQWLRARARLVFQRLCAHFDAANLLAAAAADLAACLRGNAVEDTTPAGIPNLNFDIPSHFCQHPWRLHHGTHSAVLTTSTNRRVERRTLPYVWVQGS